MNTSGPFACGAGPMRHAVFTSAAKAGAAAEIARAPATAVRRVTSPVLESGPDCIEFPVLLLACATDSLIQVAQLHEAGGQAQNDHEG